MSFRVNDVLNEQIVLNERILSLTERERKYLDSSWAVPFADILFPAIDEAPYGVKTKYSGKCYHWRINS